MTQHLAILKALTYGKLHTTALIMQAMNIYKIYTNKGGACRDNRFRELREKGYIDSQSDLLSDEIEWFITEQGRKYLEEKMRVFQ
jgi:hypothetical protein